MKHSSVEVGDGLGYDVTSFDPDGTKLFIEVKTTRGGPNTPFFLSRQEVAFSQTNARNFALLRVYEYDNESESGKFFRLDGDITDSCGLQPCTFRARLIDHGS